VDKLWNTGSFKKIWLFSDEPEVAFSYFENRHSKFIRTVPELLDSSALTLQVMRLGHGYVIGNSTYSWWGAYFNTNKDKFICYPNQWIYSKRREELVGLFPPNWFKIL
jgi:hypothetical protein